MLKYLTKKALAEDCARFEWSCLDWNKPSRDFYESISVKSQDEWIGLNSKQILKKSHLKFLWLHMIHHCILQLLFPLR